MRESDGHDVGGGSAAGGRWKLPQAVLEGFILESGDAADFHFGELMHGCGRDFGQLDGFHANGLRRRGEDDVAAGESLAFEEARDLAG